MTGRLGRLLDGLADSGCNAVVLIGADHAAHLASYARLYSGPVALVLTAEGARTLVTPTYEVDVARANADVDRVVGYGAPGFGLDPDPTAALVSAVATTLPEGRLGVDGEAGPIVAAAAKAARCTTTDVSRVIREVRLVKDEDEQAKIARSVQFALAGQAAVGHGCSSRQREIDLYTAAYSAAQTEAGTAVEFGGDLLAGDRTARVCGPVAVPGGRRPEAGDVVISDLSVRVDGYWGDTARTHIVGANPEAEAVRDFITEVLAAAAGSLRPGAIAKSIFMRMHEAILARYPDGEFPHHGGHGVGITALEDPHMVPGDMTPLRENMVLAIEPGVYFPGRFGVRVENVFVVTAAGGVDVRSVHDR